MTDSRSDDAPYEPRPRAEESHRERPPRSREGDDRERGGDHRRGRGLGVRVDGNIERAIKTFRKRVERDGLLKELRRRRFYEKPSERRKRKQREAAKRRRKAARRGR